MYRVGTSCSVPVKTLFKLNIDKLFGYLKKNAHAHVHNSITVVESLTVEVLDGLKTTSTSSFSMTSLINIKLTVYHNLVRLMLIGQHLATSS